jgi:LPS O-antigen subunit length determinant protein (WzzB/FepE family)
MPNLTEPPVLDLKASLKKPIQWAVAAGLLTAVITLFMPNYYRSEARLLPVESKGLGGGLGGLATAAAAFGVSVPGGEGNEANFVDILNSRSLREQLLQTEFQYHARSWRFGAERLEKGTLYAYVGEKNMDRAVKKVGEILSAARDLKSKVITLSAETKSPELSQQVVQRAGKLLETFLQEKGHTRGGAKAIFAEARLAEARGEMDQAEEAFRRFLEGNRNYQSSGDPAVRLRGTRLESELRLRQQLVTTLAMNREQALLEEKNDIPILNLLDSGNLPIDKSRPARSSTVLLMMVITGVMAWGLSNQNWIRFRLLGHDENTASSS